jgi:hypothetical protein
MAPRFETWMYQVHISGNDSEALICFPSNQDELIFPFRDKLADGIINTHEMRVHKEHGYILPPDSLFRFYRREHQIYVEQFLQRKRPGFFYRLIHTADWLSYRKEKKKYHDAIDVEIETSHDFPCIVMRSRIHAEEALCGLIEEVAEALGMQIPRNKELGSIKEVVTSNRHFRLS